MIKSIVMVKSLPINLIDRPVSPDRVTLDPEHIKDLAASIAEVGLLTPIDVCPRGDRFEVIAGDCRLAACKSLGWVEIPGIVKEVDQATLEVLRATENLQRKDLTVIEEARIYSNLHINHQMTWDQIAKRTGKSPALIKRRYDLLKLPEILTKALHEKKISYSVAEELFGLGDVGKIEYYLGFCVDHGATQSIVREWVKEEKARERQNVHGTERGTWANPIVEMKPVYVPCDLCHGPMEIGKETVIRACSDCYLTIKQNM